MRGIAPMRSQGLEAPKVKHLRKAFRWRLKQQLMVRRDQQKVLTDKREPKRSSRQ